MIPVISPFKTPGDGDRLSYSFTSANTYKGGARMQNKKWVAVGKEVFYCLTQPESAGRMQTSASAAGSRIERRSFRNENFH